MRVALYEWCCSGGLRGPDAEAVVGPGRFSPAAAGLRAEGRAMVEAILRDAARAPDLCIELLLDSHLAAAGGGAGRLPGDAIEIPAGVTVTPVAPGDEQAALVRSASAADFTLIIAPETGGVLAERVAAARAGGARVVLPSGIFIDVATNKQATAVALAAAGVPVPAGRVLQAGESLPEGFVRPAVAKALASCGGDGLVIVARGADLPPAPFSRRIEVAVAGQPVGVSVLCGPAATHPLPPVRQRYSAGDQPRYLGGDLDLTPSQSRRATALALRAVRAIGNATGTASGWVGVDMVLGLREDGVDDRVLEVNPRMTTSFVGLSTLSTTSLLGAMLAVATGGICRWPGAGTGADGRFASDGGRPPERCLETDWSGA